MQIFKNTIEFYWDKGNKDKSLIKHGITDTESEAVFFDEKKKILQDTLHSQKEKRFIIIGRTKLNNLLYMVFTIRGGKLRIISARTLNKKEKFLYEKTT